MGLNLSILVHGTDFVSIYALFVSAVSVSDATGSWGISTGIYQTTGSGNTTCGGIGDLIGINSSADGTETATMQSTPSSLPPTANSSQSAGLELHKGIFIGVAAGLGAAFILWCLGTLLRHRRRQQRQKLSHELGSISPIILPVGHSGAGASESDLIPESGVTREETASWAVISGGRKGRNELPPAYTDTPVPGPSRVGDVDGLRI